MHSKQLILGEKDSVIDTILYSSAKVSDELKSRGRFANRGVDFKIEGVDLRKSRGLICANQGGRFAQIEGSISNRVTNRGGRFAQIKGSISNRGVDFCQSRGLITNRGVDYKSTTRIAQIEGSICKSTPSISYKANFQTKSL